MVEKTPSQEGPRGLLKRTTPADQGLIELPRLTPHLGFHVVDDEQVLLVSETFNTLLRGRIHCDLMPLLDGGRSAQEIVVALAPAHSALEVQTAILALASRGYVVSGDYGMAPGRAAYWSSLGASPRWAEHCLGAAAVAVSGEAVASEARLRLACRLEGLGVPVRDPGAARSSLAVTVCGDYLDERHDAINRRHLESGTPWVLVRPNGMQPLFGPVFRPAEGGACWACLAYRLRGHREVHGFVRTLDLEASVVEPRAAEPTVLEAMCGLAAVEIARWLVLEDLAPIHECAISLDVAVHRTAQHPAMRRPQCLACGDEALHRADRPAEPVRLRASPRAFRNSGGHRSVPPEKTLARYRHLVSPVTGVVTWLARTAEETDPWLHVYWAGSDLAPRGSKLRSLRRSLRSKSAGKGSSRQQSEASALCEAVERYCGAFHGDEIRCRKRLADFDKAGESEAVHPNDVQLFSDRQLDDADRINARGHPYNFVPPRLDPDTEIDWSPVWSLTQGRHRYLPTSILYGMVEAVGEGSGPGFKADSNGCAAGNTLEEAILQGFLELVERDAFAIWWYNRLRLPEVDLASFGDAYLASARDYYRQRNRELWVLDATSDFGIPVFVAISRRTDGETEDIIYGAGAHMDPHIAALRAVCELNQCLQWILGPAQAGGAASHDPVSQSWWRTGRLTDHPYLAPASGVARRDRSDYAVPDTSDTREDVEHCRALVEACGMEFLVLDQTRPDIGMPVARVIVPGMRHFWERFAPGRLFDVPVSMGWRERRLSEQELNPVPVVA
ncbi:MAG: TOMM precursor leader peptide-binding protein [Gemmatimonadetes bacterium]|nr:TOMM precursor leader peptide-binding protein [Gemmatimonadota bacterium]MCY3678155.1 TOMM precursor leader peptide-binding protein [Gemmatimonadota bacterium]MYA44204.1 TOMM precursor leader peptide-binding protein [Gemmatimonadota bacterium]MYE91738.1 TOMM precursor leader peptide-binding protein [Gemmatimonadota bacterium]MYJ09991.1 TOMM precursor leader peptide-binding protein [Gemmatimonadota bacterium]